MPAHMVLGRISPVAKLHISTVQSYTEGREYLLKRIQMVRGVLGIPVPYLDLGILRSTCGAGCLQELSHS